MGGIQLCLAGASIGNGNRGVEALGRSVLDTIHAQAPGSTIWSFDDGWGVRPEETGRYEGSDVEYVGVRLSRRWHRPESWARIAAAQRFGGARNPVAARIARSAAVLDISGGDSFSDLYGWERLRAVAAPKQAALRGNRPLVLLPQTYGPFETGRGRQLATRLIRASFLAYARDPESHGRLLELAGTDADHDRLRDGVDVAFALRPRRPPPRVADQVESLDGETIAGVNVSGLLCEPEGQARFGLAGDYVATVAALVTRLVMAGAHVLFVPHVHVPGGRGESDTVAIDRVLAHVEPQVRNRTTVLPPELDAAELKWCIARCDWFAGSRMHSTIAALSSGVPACGYAYSDKARGVFDTCGAGDHVVDARTAAGPDAAAAMVASFEAREHAGTVLAGRVPQVTRRAREQIAEILDDVRQWQSSGTRMPVVAAGGAGRG